MSSGHPNQINNFLHGSIGQNSDSTQKGQIQGQGHSNYSQVKLSGQNGNNAVRGQDGRCSDFMNIPSNHNHYGGPTNHNQHNQVNANIMPSQLASLDNALQNITANYNKIQLGQQNPSNIRQNTGGTVQVQGLIPQNTNGQQLPPNLQIPNVPIINRLINVNNQSNSPITNNSSTKPAETSGLTDTTSGHDTTSTHNSFNKNQQQHSGGNLSIESAVGRVTNSNSTNSQSQILLNQGHHQIKNRRSSSRQNSGQLGQGGGSSSKTSSSKMLQNTSQSQDYNSCTISHPSARPSTIINHFNQNLNQNHNLNFISNNDSIPRREKLGREVQRDSSQDRLQVDLPPPPAVPPSQTTASPNSVSAGVNVNAELMPMLITQGNNRESIDNYEHHNYNYHQIRSRGANIVDAAVYAAENNNNAASRSVRPRMGVKR